MACIVPETESITYKNCFINNLPLSDNIGYIIIESNWNNDNIECSILEYSNPIVSQHPKEWYGILTINSLKETAEVLEIEFDDFLSQTKAALCTQNGLPNFKYSIVNCEFVYRKIDTDDNKIRFGVVKLQPKPNLGNKLLLNSLSLVAHLREAVAKEEISLISMKKEYQEYVETSEKIIGEKNKNEKIMFSKFLELLNTKKDKISELQELLNDNSLSTVKETTKQQSNWLSDCESSEEIFHTSSQNKRNKSNVKCLSQDSFSQDEEALTPTVIPKRSKLIESMLQQDTWNRNHESTSSFKDVKIDKSTLNEKDKYDVDTQEMFDEI